MQRKELKELGFIEIPHYTIGNSLTYDLGRNRNLSISCLGTPNEMVWITESDSLNDRIVNEVICLRNYDYDGYTTIDMIKNIIQAITNKI